MAESVKLTGRQNSSKAGLTKVMYWLSTCSRSRPLSLMSLRTMCRGERDENERELKNGNQIAETHSPITTTL